MRILFFTKYSEEGASSRLRSYQYFPLLKEDGIEVVAKPLFDTNYIKDILKGNRSVIKIVTSYVKRFMVLFSIRRFDTIVIEKELFPFCTSLFEKMIVLLGFHYTVIYDDAIFHNYDLHHNKLLRFLFRKKIDRVMKYSSCVIAGNDYLKDRAIRSGAKRITVIPTVINIDRYKQVQKFNNENIIIGWIGSPSSFHYLKLVEESLRRIIKKYNVKIHLIGTNEKLNIEEEYIEYIKWSEETETKELQKFTLGIMPLIDNPWALGKCSYKLVQYMGCGIPVIASPVGMNKEVVKDGYNGFLAETENDWDTCFENLIKDSNLRKEMGRRGRELVENHFSLKNSYHEFKTSII